MRKTPFKKSYRGTLFFFPALLPLAELLPWIFTLLAAVAGTAGFSFPAFWNKHKRKVVLLVVCCLLVALNIYLYNRPSAEVSMNGTRLIAAQNHAQPLVFMETEKAVPQDPEGFGQIWSVTAGQQILSAPVASGDKLVFGTLDNSVEAVFLHDGSSAWFLETQSPVFSMTAGKDGIVYSGEGLHHTTSAALSAIKADTGHIIWQREFLGHLEEEATIDHENERILTSAGPGGLWAMDKKDARVLWHADIGHIDSRALVLDGVVYVPADIDEANHKTSLFALDEKTGEPLWQLPLQGQPWGSPKADRTGKIILTSTGRGQIGKTKETDAGWAYGVSTDGKQIWQTLLPGMALQPATYLAETDTIIYTAKNGFLVSLNAADGSLKWAMKISDDIRAAATLIDGYDTPMLAVTNYDGTLSIRNALNGQEIASRAVGTHATGSPLVHEGKLYVVGARMITAFGGLGALAEETQ